MIDQFSLIAKLLSPYRWLSYVVALVFLASIIYVNLYLPLSLQNMYNLPFLMIIIWVAVMNLAIVIFKRVPTVTLDKQSIISRFKTKVMRFFYYIVAIAFVVLTIAVTILSIRLFGVWYRL